MADDMNDLNDLIDMLLAERRPDRYEPEGGGEWLDEIADEIASKIPAATAQQHLASTLVQRREGVKTQRANRIIRDIGRTGQQILGWLDAMSLPLAVAKERVAMRALTNSDLDQFAIDERRTAANDFATRNETCEAAEWLASRMRIDGAVFLADLRLDDPDDTAA